MSYHYESQRRRQGYGASGPRSAFGYWVPLALTVTVATIGLAAWIWSERKDEDDEYDRDRRDDGRPSPIYGDLGPGQTSYAQGAQGHPGPPAEDASVIARMSGALRRTPSPQQMLDGASRRVAAGVAAAGAVVGGALSSIREEDKKDFEDHSRWSEEAEARVEGSLASGGPRMASNVDAPTRQMPLPQKPDDRRKAVAIVVSAERKHHGNHDEEVAYIQEHAVSDQGLWMHSRIN